MTETFFMPDCMASLHQALSEMTEKSKVISGGTDLILELNTGKIKPDCLLHLGKLQEAHGIWEAEDYIWIGAMTDMTTIASSAIIRRSCAALCDAAAHVGSVQIRNKATIGGNVANASPAGDLIVPLWLMHAQALIAGPQGTRVLDIQEVVTGINQISLAHNEVILSFRYRTLEGNHYTAYQKLGSRSEVTISRVGLAVGITFQEDIVQRASVMLGAVSPTPVHVPVVQDILIGTQLDEQSITAAGAALSAYILEINHRPNRFYKSHAAKGVLCDVLDAIKTAI